MRKHKLNLRQSFERARAIAALEGFTPNKEDLELDEKIIRGEITIEAAIHELKKQASKLSKAA